MAIEDDVREVLASLDEQDTTIQDAPASTKQEEGKRVIHVDKYILPDGSEMYRFPNGEAVLLPNDDQHTFDAHAVESDPLVTKEQDTPVTEVPLVENGQNEGPPQEYAEAVLAGTRRRVKPSFVLVPLVLLIILAAGAGTYLFVLPLTATATITITPEAQTLQKDVTFPIAAHPKAGQVQGRPLEAISFTKSKTVPATGHAHDDATRAAGIVTFYNADSQSYTIPAGTSFTVQGVTIVTDTTVIVQAVVPPMLGTAYVSAHVIQAGSAGNIAAHTIDTRCCGSAFITATNTTPFSGGQDARTYSFIQSSDIQNAATDLLGSLTPQATVALQQQAHTGEQLVTPLCNPRTQESAEPGSEGASVTVSVTQTCTSVAYRQDSLQQVATRTLAQSASTHLARYEQIGTVQVTVNGSMYTNRTATLQVSLSGVWVYRFTQAQVQHVTQEIAGESQEQARATLEKVDGVVQVSIHLQRLDFKDLLPTNPQRITVQFFYIVS